ncbi:hypothetical protein Tco_0963549, partial [Tanacetum coccineum]
TQREAQKANELSNLTRQRQLLASANNRRAIIEELERLPGNFMACHMASLLPRPAAAARGGSHLIQATPRPPTSEILASTPP